jgi:protein subunit release factor A
LRARILAGREAEAIAARNASRRARVGCGARGDKIRSPCSAAALTDHVTGESMPLEKYLAGRIADLR